MKLILIALLLGGLLGCRQEATSSRFPEAPPEATDSERQPIASEAVDDPEAVTAEMQSLIARVDDEATRQELTSRADTLHREAKRLEDLLAAEPVRAVLEPAGLEKLRASGNPQRIEETIDRLRVIVEQSGVVEQAFDLFVEVAGEVDPGIARDLIRVGEIIAESGTDLSPENIRELITLVLKRVLTVLAQVFIGPEAGPVVEGVLDVIATKINGEETGGVVITESELIVKGTGTGTARRLQFPPDFDVERLRAQLATGDLTAEVREADGVLDIEFTNPRGRIAFAVQQTVEGETIIRID